MTILSQDNVISGDQPLVVTLLGGEQFWPSEPQSVAETGLSETFLEALTCKLLLFNGDTSGRRIARELCLPFSIVDPILARLRTAQIVVHRGAGPINDYVYALTEEGLRRARAYKSECGYVGPAPVPLMDYIISVEAQAIADEPIRQVDLLDALHGLSVAPELLALLGPAVNSANGLFLYGAPGNGKTTLAKGITSCFGQDIWLPHAFFEGQEIVKVFDPAFHREAGGRDEGPGAMDGFDRRWLRVRRPTVVVGGELTLDNLEISHDPATNVSESPLQVKSNCGCLLIDDFGRQRISPADLLNRWIIPLENRHDFLTLGSGKKIQVPFEQLIIFSTNLDPAELVDEAFIRRIPYRIEVTDPTDEEFHGLFRLAADQAGCEYRREAVDYLLDKHYRPHQRPLRRCHPRDLLQQIRNYCKYHELPLGISPEYFDHVAQGFFTEVRTKELAGTER